MHSRSEASAMSGIERELLAVSVGKDLQATQAIRNPTPDRRHMHCFPCACFDGGRRELLPVQEILKDTRPVDAAMLRVDRLASPKFPLTTKLKYLEILYFYINYLYIKYIYK